MKGLMIALMFFSQLLFSQNNIAVFHANKTTVSAPSTVGKAVAIAPFDLINGMAVVKASIDGVMGNFILDTGSPGLVINSALHPNVSEYAATSVGGAVEIGETTIHRFKFGIIEREDLTGFTIDITHLEEAVGRKLAGLIGYEILQQYEVFFDYPNGMVKIYDAASALEFRKEKPLVEVPFEMMGHIPVIKVGVGNKKAILGLDSGAEVNLLDRSYLKKLNRSCLKNKDIEKVVGLDQIEHEAEAATLNSSNIKRNALPDMKFLFMDLKELSRQFENRFDGLLGFPFFQQHALSINYQERKIYIWE